MDRAAWRTRVDRDLRGADYTRELVQRLLDGRTVEPLHDETTTPTAHEPAGQPGASPFTRGRTAAGATAGWDLRARVAAADPAEAAAQVRHAASLGATSVRLRVGPGGVEADGPAALAPVLAALPDGMGLDLVADALDAEVWAPLAHRATLGLDPLAGLARTGALAPLPVALGRAGHARISTGVISDAGGAAAHELGWALACGAAWLRALLDDGAALSEASAALTLDLAIDTRLFADLAKVRAARLTWARLTEACGAAQGLRVHAVQARRHLTRRDPWVNLLRGTAAAVAGVLGGAEAVVVRPYDSATGPASEQGRRLALTTQLLLRDESHLHRLVDPAGGSWAVESMTADLAAAAWAELQAIEAAGGPAEALRSGWLRRHLAAAAEVRQRRLDTRRQAITGVSAFPSPEPAMGPPPSAPHPGALLPVQRLAEGWEALRDAADAAGPVAALVVLGPLRERSARTTWIRNLLAAGGFTVEEHPAGGAPPAAAVAVICGADDRTAVEGPGVARALTDAGCTVAVAGALSPALAQAGATVALRSGADVRAALVTLLRAAGVEVSA